MTFDRSHVYYLTITLYRMSSIFPSIFCASGPSSAIHLKNNDLQGIFLPLNETPLGRNFAFRCRRRSYRLPKTKQCSCGIAVDLGYMPECTACCDYRLEALIRQAGKRLLRATWRALSPLGPTLVTSTSRSHEYLWSRKLAGFQPIRNHWQRADPHTRRVENGVADGGS
jgi:hypothetical protein